MLARVLGEVYRGDVAEIGGCRSTTDPELVPWFQWHFDTFTSRRARPDRGNGRRSAGVRVGAQPGLQFHPEVTPRSCTTGSALPPRAGRRGRRPRRCSTRPTATPRDRRTAMRLLERSWTVSRGSVRPRPAMIRTEGSDVFHRFLDLPYPNVERGRGVWLTTIDGRRILDACSGGAMVACLGHGSAIAAAAAEQAEKISYFYNHHFTSEPQERLADRLLGLTPEMARVRFVSGVRKRTRRPCSSPGCITSNAERPTAGGDLARAGVPRVIDGHAGPQRTASRPGAVHAVPLVAPAPAASTWRFDPTGDAPSPSSTASSSERRRDRRVQLRAWRGRAPTRHRERFWRGLAERRKEHGFLICFDEVVTGIGRVGSWLAAHQLPIEPDIVGASARGTRRSGSPGPAGGLRRDRPRLARVRPRTHVGRGPAVLRRRAGRARPHRGKEPRGSGARARPGLRGRAPRALADSASRRSVGEASSWAWSSWTRATACRSCRRARRRRDRRRHGVRTRPAGDVHPVRRRMGSPATRCSSRPPTRAPTPSSPRWSNDSRRR